MIILLIAAGLILVGQIFMGLATLRLANEIRQGQRIPVVLPEILPIITSLPAVALKGGAIRFELDNGTRSILDCGDGDGTFAAEVGTEMIVTFQRAR